MTVSLHSELYVRLPSPLVPLEHPLFIEKKLQVWIKREDLIHPQWGGNKFRKLKYNLQAYREGAYQGLVTFGGLHSNHIFAVAAIANHLGIPAHGVIRGAEPLTSPTLEFALSKGMILHRVERSAYRTPAATLAALGLDSPDFYQLPEGGTNDLALKGCAEISIEIKAQLGHWPDGIACSFGTGGTAAGMMLGMEDSQKLMIFPALKGDWIQEEMERLLLGKRSIAADQIFSNAHFGGYGKTKPALITFIQEFYSQTKIPLDPIYTGKLLFGFMDLVKKDHFTPHSEWVLIHSGGLQGNHGFNQRFNTDLPTPDYIFRYPS